MYKLWSAACMADAADIPRYPPACPPPPFPPPSFLEIYPTCAPRARVAERTLMTHISTGRRSAPSNWLTCLTPCQYIHQGCLSGPRDPHQAGEHPWAEGPTDPQQQLQHWLAPLTVHMVLALCCLLQGNAKCLISKQ